MQKSNTSRIFAVILAFILMLSPFRQPIWANDNLESFPDIQGHYAESVIQNWVTLNFIAGMPDGRFAPNRSISRAEFITLFNRVFQPIKTRENHKTFADVNSNHWFYQDVLTAGNLGIVTGYANGNFSPDEPITRQDATVILSRYLKLADVYDNASFSTFIDKDMISDYAAAHIAAMAELKLINGKPDGNFAPHENITRADSVILLNNTYSLLANDSGISGKIYADGKILANAIVTILPKDTYQPINTLTTDHNGFFHSKLAVGDYDLYITKDNYIGFKSELSVRSEFQSFIKLNAKAGQEVKAILKDSNGKPLKDTALYFKTNPYFVTKSDNEGKISLFLPKNRNFEYFYEKDGKLIYIDTFSTKEKGDVLNLGVLSLKKNNKSSTPVNSSAFVPTPKNETPSTPAPIIPEENNPRDLPPEAKELLGLDPQKIDNDADGLNDYFEFSYLTTNLLMVDSDGNGISDAEEDFDQDGLTNLQEQTLGSRPDRVDSDGDGLSDGDEVNIYQTNPVTIDSDKDGLDDNEELKLGLNPTLASSDGITPDNERTFHQTVSQDMLVGSLQNAGDWLIPTLAGEVSGDINKHVSIEKTDNYILKDNRSIISDALIINTSYQQPLDLSFAYTHDYAGNLQDLILASYDENGISLIETTLDTENNLLTGQISGSGTYFVLDLNEFLKSLGIDVFSNLKTTTLATSALPETMEEALTLSVEENSDYKYFYDQNGNLLDKKRIYSEEDNAIENLNLHRHLKGNVSEASSAAIDWESSILSLPVLQNKATGKVDIAFVLDTTSSMDDDILNVAANVNAFVDKLTTEHNIDANFSVITYSDIIHIPDSTKIHKHLHSNWFTNIDVFKQEITRIAKNDVGQGWDETPLDGLAMAKNLDWRKNSTKFVILLTDEWSSQYNTYGYENINALAEAFAKDKIYVSVITEPALKKHYRVLWEKNNGLFASIFDNFGSILFKLADKIGNITNSDGEWVFLSDFQAVKLGTDLDNAANYDSDKDGLTDATELGTSEERDMTPYINALINRHLVPPEAYQGKTKLTVWLYNSNPVLPDTDYDGLPDGNIDYDGQIVTPDAHPKDNSFAGTLTWYEDGPKNSVQKLNFKVNYSLLFEDNKFYQKDLAKFSILNATDIYKKSYLTVTDGITGGSDDPTTLARLFGLKDVENISINGANYGIDTDDSTELVIGHRQVTYKGMTKEIVLVTLRGTNGTHEEWTSNFDVGADTTEYYTATGQHPDWRNKQNHKGFDVAANRALDKIEDYLTRYSLKGKSTSLLLTGHSRAAAIANIIGAHYEKADDILSFTYTFATPNLTTSSDAGNYKTIFNIVNTDDMIPFMPLSQWGFKKYGITKDISVEKHYENHSGPAKKGTWEWFVGRDYDNDSGTQRTLNAFAKIAANREQLYLLDDSNEAKVWERDLGHVTRSGAERELKELNVSLTKEKLRRFCNLYIVGGGWFTPYHVEVNYSPAYAMQVMANMITGVGPKLGRDLAGKYADAKTSFVLSSGAIGIGNLRLGGMTHPHLPITYYVIVYNDFQ